MPIKFTDVLKVEMWEIFDFGHEVSIKELREAVSRLLEKSD